MKNNQYVVAKLKDEKPFLARISKIKDNGEVLVVLEKDAHRNQSTVSLTKKDIRLNLGINPLPGKVHGFDLNNLFRKTIEHDFWGTIHFFVAPEKEKLKLFRTALETTAKRVQKLGLEDFVPLFDTEIRAKTGKYAGMYRHSKDVDKVPHTVWFAIDCATDLAYMEYLIYHELGHAVRFNGMRRHTLRNKWIRMYQRTVAPVQIKKDVLAKVLKDISEYDETEESWNHVYKQATSELGPRVNKAVLQWLKQTHKIGPKELEVMWRSSGTKDLTQFWPTHTVDTHDLKPAVSDYATKNVEELWAESFAFYCQRKKLPQKIHDLIETSLSVAKVEVNKDPP